VKGTTLPEVIENVLSIVHKSKTTIQQYLVGENDEFDLSYMAVRMPFLIPNRDFVVERLHDRVRRNGSMMTVNRSIENDDVKSLKESNHLRRVRGTMHAYGYLLKEGQRKGTVDVVHVAMVDLNGLFALDLLSRIVAILRVKGTLEMFNSNFEETERGRFHSSVFDVFSGFKNILKGSGKDMLEDGKIDLCEIYGGDGGGRESEFAGENPMQKNAKKAGGSNRNGTEQLGSDGRHDSRKGD